MTDPTIDWNNYRHPLKRVGVDDAGTIWCHAQWHPGGAAKCRDRAIETRASTRSVSGTLFIRVEWLAAEFDIELERLTRAFEISAAINMESSKKVILRAIKLNAPITS